MSTAAQLNNELFHGYLSLISNVSSRVGIKHNYNPQNDDFASLPMEIKQHVIDNLSTYAEVLSELERTNQDIYNTHELLDQVLKTCGFTLPKGVFEKIGPSDHWELFSADLVPLFKSLPWFEYTSYDLSEIYAKPYHELYARDEFYQAAINRVAKQIMSQEKVVIENPVPEHVAWEINGPVRCLIRYKLISSFYADGELAGALVVHDLKRLS